MELVTNIAMARQSVNKGQPSMFGPSKAVIDRAMRENADLKQKIMRLRAEQEAALKGTEAGKAALEAAKNDLAVAQKTIASLRQQVVSLTASLDELKAKKSKKDKKPEPESSADSSNA